MKVVKYMQEGGAMPVAPEAAPQGGMPAEGQDPLMQIAEIFSQGLQSGDCQMLAQGAEAFLQLLSQAMGQGPQGPVDQAPQGEPVFRRGGVISRRK